MGAVGVVTMLVLMHVDGAAITRRGSSIPPSRYDRIAGAGLPHARLAQHASLDSLRRFFHLQPSEIAKPVLVLFLAWFLQTRLGAMRDWKRTLLPAALIPGLFIVLVAGSPTWARRWCWPAYGNDAGAGGDGMEVSFWAPSPPRCPCWPRCCSWFRGGGRACWSFSIPNPIRRAPAITLSVAHRRRHRRSDRARLYGRDAEAVLSARGCDRLIFANIAEELGFIGAMFIVLLFGLFGVRGLRTAFRCSDPFARLAAFGITVTILLQAFFNISVVLSLVPNKGIPLPLISHGGTSLFCTLASIGILLNISRQAE